MMNSRKVIISLFLVSILAACSLNSSSLRYDYTYLYQENQQLIKPKFKVFHSSKDSSTLYFEFDSDNILYGKLQGDSSLTARVLCKYRVYHPEKKGVLIDSATVPLLNYGENNASKVLQAAIKMQVPFGNRYPIELRFRDQYRDLNVVYSLWADKRDNRNQQYYLLKKGNQVIADQVIKTNEPHVLLKSPLLPEGLYKQIESSTEYQMVPPPFAVNVQADPKPLVDTIYNQIFTGDSAQLHSFSKKNWLFPTYDSSQYAAYFYYYHDGFPEITNYEQMVGPIRYISTSTEYKKLEQAVNLKKEMDNFWLQLGKEPERAQKMIREYYRRVELANRWFTSYKEGWKTDRGIIFIVYGEPTTIYKSINSETWIYGEENNILSIKFNFNLMDNPMSENDYELQRNSDWKNNWYRAVDSWRQAKIY